MIESELKLNEIVNVIRQVGKKGKQEIVKGVIVRFPMGILINGKRTALVKYLDNNQQYVHAIDEIVID